MEKDINSSVEFVNKSRFATCFHNMQILRNERKFCDINLKVDDKVIHAHRIVLAATIPFFRAMFECDMTENRQKDVAMPGIEYDVLESLVNFAYSGQLRVDAKNAPSILAGSSFLMLERIEQFCLKFLLKSLTPENALKAKEVAEFLGKDDLSHTADVFIERHFYFVAKSFAFKSADTSIQLRLRRIYGHVPPHRPICSKRSKEHKSS